MVTFSENSKPADTKHQEMLRVIVAYWIEHGRGPTYRELRDTTQVALNSVISRVHALTQQGVLVAPEVERGAARTIRPTPATLRDHARGKCCPLCATKLVMPALAPRKPTVKKRAKANVRSRGPRKRAASRMAP